VFGVAGTKRAHLKIVHISDSDGGGGAANAMSRLHEALQRLGAESRLLVRNSQALANAVETVATRGDADELFPAVREAVVRQYVELNRTSLTNTHFSLHIDGADLSRLPVVASSDVVHLHWAASFQTPADVGALFSAKPVVWTLHDLEPLTGGCHFPAGCERYAGDCAGCPQLARDPFDVTATTLRDKKTLWAGARPTFIAPSRYIAECARRSAVAQHIAASIVHIPHGIDVEVFRPRSKGGARRALGIPVDGTYVLCGSNYNAEKRKGLGHVDRVLAAAKADLPLDAFKVKLLTVGEPKLDLHDLDGIEVVQLGRVSLDVMPTVYAAADVLLYPALEDNFPCMLLESLSCGTPAIAFDIGGIPDIVQDEVSGRIVAAGDELAMAAALSSLIGDPQRLQLMSRSARAHIEEHFRAESVARKHAELYDDVAERRAAPGLPAGRSRRSGIDEIFPRWSTSCLIRELAAAREHASTLVEQSRAKSEHIALLERQATAQASSWADQSRQVQEKEAELAAIHAVARERKALAESLHVSVARNEATIAEQRAEIELIHHVAAERRRIIEELHGSASARTAAVERDAAGLVRNLADQSRQVHEKEAELTAIHAVVEERKAVAEATIGEQRAEIELVHRIAAERQLLIEDVHRSKEVELSAIHAVAEERKALAETLHASAASKDELAANLRREVRERDDLLAALEATMAEQRAEIELVHRIAADRQRLIEDLHRVAEERAEVIDRLSAAADAAAVVVPAD
jgi:glycosyltransferase involved in cell wall biosynthesis